MASQTYPHIEHVIIDGASKDDTLDIIARHSIPGAVVVSEPDRGIYDAWNKGIRKATGDYIWLLNSDDRIYDNDTIEKAVGFLVANSSPEFIYGKVKGMESASGYSYISGKPTNLRDFVYGMRNFCILATIIRRDVFSRVGYFNENYRISSDYDWAISAFKKLPQKETIFYDSILTNFSVGGVSNLRYKEAYREVSEIAKVHFSRSDYFRHRAYIAWRLFLMSILPYARSMGVLHIWRTARGLLN